MSVFRFSLFSLTCVAFLPCACIHTHPAVDVSDHSAAETPLATSSNPPSIDDADFFSRLEHDVELAKEDYRHFYQADNLALLGLGIAGAAPLANTSADQDVRDWYQQRIKTSSLNTLSAIANVAGQAWVIVPLWSEIAALRGDASEAYELDGGFREWSNRSLRAIAVGYPPIVALSGLLGAGRPDSGDAHWQPFHHLHGVSGHTFMGAVPWLTAAAMTEEWWLKAPFVAGSLLTGWSRIHEDRHYLSQVVLGWWIAYLSVRSVGETQDERRAVSIVPTASETGAGIGVVIRY